MEGEDVQSEAGRGDVARGFDSADLSSESWEEREMVRTAPKQGHRVVVLLSKKVEENVRTRKSKRKSRGGRMGEGA